MLGQGRPSKYSPELADRICEQIADGKSMRTICKQEGMPGLATIFVWLRENNSFQEQYAKAKEMQADALFEEVLDIADASENDLIVIETDDGPITKVNNEVIQRSRLRVDTRKWMAGKLRPKKYGDKIEQTVQGPDGGPVNHSISVSFVSNKPA